MWIEETQLNPGPEIGKGGEATVFSLTNLPGEVFKKYTNPVSADVRTKIEWMVNHPPAAEALERLAWPTRLVKGANDELSGYIMRRLPEETVELGVVFTQNEEKILKRLKRGPFTLRDRHVIAMNLAVTLAACHREGYVIVDFNHKNIHVSAKGHVFLIDNDSFQIRGANGTLFPCNGVAVAEYHSPELKSSLDTRRVKSTHDAFVLAVLIFKLLMDSVHPFRGSTDFADENGPPDEHKLLKMRMYPYDLLYPAAGVRPHIAAPSLARLHKSIVTSFQKCFGKDGLDHPKHRPAAQEWIQVLQNAIPALGQCQRGHWYSTDRNLCLTKGGNGAYCASTKTKQAGSIPAGGVNVLTGVLTSVASRPTPNPNPAQKKQTSPPVTQVTQTAPTTPKVQPTPVSRKPVTPPPVKHKTPVTNPIKTGPPVTSSVSTATSRATLSIPRWQTGNATVDNASKQTQAILQHSGQSLQQTWGTARQRTMGKPARIIAIVAIAAVAFQTGLLGSFVGFATSFLDDPLEGSTSGIVQADPPQENATGNGDIATSTEPAGIENEAAPEPDQPTIAPQNLTVDAETSWLVIATSGSSLYVNREPNLQFPILAFPDGTHLEILDSEIIAADGYHWQHVRAPNGVEGWVATEFTIPGTAP